MEVCSCFSSSSQTLPLASSSSSGRGFALGSWLARSSPVTTVSIPASAGGSTSSSEANTGTLDLPVAGECSLGGTSASLVSAGNLGLLDSGVLVLLSLGVAVEVQVGHDIPLGLAGGQGAPQAEDLAGEHPPDETNGVATLVVRGDGNVDVLGGGVGVAEGDDGDVDVGSLLDGLGIGARIRHDDETGLTERTGDVVGEVTGGEATGDGDGTGVRGELEDGTLAIRTGGDDTDVGGVVDGDDDTGSEDNLLPAREIHELVKKEKFLVLVVYRHAGFANFKNFKKYCIRHCNRVIAHRNKDKTNVPGLANVDNVDTVLASLPEVGLHVHLEVLGAEMGLSSEEHLNVLLGRVENCGEVGRSHLGRLFKLFGGEEQKLRARLEGMAWKSSKIEAAEGKWS